MKAPASTTKKSGSKLKRKGATRVKKKRVVRFGRVYIKATFNNTLVMVSDAEGNKLTQSSAGACGQKGSRKGTPYAATMASMAAVKAAMDIYSLERAEVYVAGPGSGREQAIKAVQEAGLIVTLIEDRTSIPHNGCRPPKERRV